MKNPVVSICIPVKDMARTIGQTVESAIAQTYDNIEVLVVDNQSTDRTFEIVSSLPDRRIRIIQNERDIGVFGNHNRCVELAKGDLIKFLHADDLLHRQCVEEMVKPFEETDSGDVGCVVCGAIELSPTDEEFRRTAVPPKLLHVSGGRFFEMVPLIGNFIGTPSRTLLRKSAVQRAGGFDPARRHGGDLDCWLRLSQRYEFAFLPTHLVSIRDDPPPTDPAKRYDYRAVLFQLDLYHTWFLKDLGGVPLWRSPLGRWMCRSSLRYVLAYAREALKGRPGPLREVMRELRRYGLIPQLLIQLLVRGPSVLTKRFFPRKTYVYAKVAEFFANLNQ